MLGRTPKEESFFCNRPDRRRGPLQHPAQWKPRLFSAGKAAGPWPYSAEIKGRVEPYLYCLPEKSWPILGLILVQNILKILRLCSRIPFFMAV